MIFRLFLLIVLSYLIGSIPTAYLAGRLKSGFDIRRSGTGNMGASNALLVIGPAVAFTVYLVDLFKGLVPVLIARSFAGSDVAMSLCGIAAVLGHDFPVFIGFKGGKGVATTTGAMFGINAVIMWLLVASWLIFLLITNDFILSSLLCMFYIPFLMVAFGLSWTFVACGSIFFLIGLFTHRQDVVRIARGEGSKAFDSVRKYLSR